LVALLPLILTVAPASAEPEESVTFPDIEAGCAATENEIKNRTKNEKIVCGKYFGVMAKHF